MLVQLNGMGQYELKDYFRVRRTEKSIQRPFNACFWEYSFGVTPNFLLNNV